MASVHGFGCAAVVSSLRLCFYCWPALTSIFYAGQMRWSCRARNRLVRPKAARGARRLERTGVEATDYGDGPGVRLNGGRPATGERYRPRSFCRSYWARSQPHLHARRVPTNSRDNARNNARSCRARNNQWARSGGTSAETSASPAALKAEAEMHVGALIHVVIKLVGIGSRDDPGDA